MSSRWSTFHRNVLLLGYAVYLSLVTAPTLQAAAFSDLIVFGDSLSDVGNLSRATLGLQPSSDYYMGRFSNGPVYAEVLADGLGFPPIRGSLSGGNNFAYGGARTSGTSFFEGGFLINDLDEQIDEYLDERTLDPDALYVVLSGANDFILGDQTNPAIPARRVQQQITRLLNRGIRQLLSINVPLLGLTPGNNTNADRKERLNGYSTEFNVLLADTLETFRTERSELTIYEMDLARLVNDVVADPDEFGFTNTTQAGIRVANPTGYVFWDDTHPTTEAHALIGKLALRTVLADRLQGDFDNDGVLDVDDIDLLGTDIAEAQHTFMFDLTDDELVATPDLNTWLTLAEIPNADADFSGAVDFADFLVLAQNFGSEMAVWSQGDYNADGRVQFSDFLIVAQTFGTMASARSVPEPAALGLLTSCLACLIWFRQQLTNYLRERK